MREVCSVSATRGLLLLHGVPQRVASPSARAFRGLLFGLLFELSGGTALYIGSRLYSHILAHH